MIHKILSFFPNLSPRNILGHYFDDEDDSLEKPSPKMDYTEDEMNDLSYDLALKNDKRTYWQLYFSLIKTKHEFINAFKDATDSKSNIKKIIMQ